MSTSTDPNADLIGREFPVEDGQARVTGTATWSSRGYVTVAVRRPDGSTYTTVRAAELVRAFTKED